jgi:hypothetical protein
MGSYERFQRLHTEPWEDHELAVVDAIAQEVRREVDARHDVISQAHVHGAASSSIQAAFVDLLSGKLGFEEEVVLTPQDGLVTRARPDFFHRLSPERGIIAEVERGGTTTNNHDLKDLWKAHVAPDAQHLFLFVPNTNWRADGSPRERPFPLVTRRLAAFFGNPRREVDVLSAHVFGY